LIFLQLLINSELSLSAIRFHIYTSNTETAIRSL